MCQDIPHWSETFRKPEIPPAADLANRIFNVSLKSAEALKTSIRARDEKDRTTRWFTVLCEFTYFFVHMTNRLAYAELGHDRRCRLQDELYPLVIGPTIESVLRDWPAQQKDKMEIEFAERLGDAEVEYGKCNKLLDPDNPLTENGLFSMFARNVCDLLGVEAGEAAAYAETYMKALDLAIDSFKGLHLLEAVRAIGRGP